MFLGDCRHDEALLVQKLALSGSHNFYLHSTDFPLPCNPSPEIAETGREHSAVEI